MFEQVGSCLSIVLNLNREMEMETATTAGLLVVENVKGRSTVTRCFSKYPLKFIVPKKVGSISSKTDAVWIYTLTYGGGIVSGDSISCKFSIGNDCTAVLTTQASTKVYKSLGSKCSEQILEVRVGRNAFLVVIPDPVTCFSKARYSQKQVFSVAAESNLVVVDWITSGRHAIGEMWDFDLYRSCNNIFLEDGTPLFLDTVYLEQADVGFIKERVAGYKVLAMIIVLGCKTQHVRDQVQSYVKRLMSEQIHGPSAALSYKHRKKFNYSLTKPEFLASCSVFGPQDIGLVVRVASMTTESVYEFLQHQLALLEPLLGKSPYT